MEILPDVWVYWKATMVYIIEDGATKGELKPSIALYRVNTDEGQSDVITGWKYTTRQTWQNPLLA